MRAIKQTYLYHLYHVPSTINMCSTYGHCTINYHSFNRIFGERRKNYIASHLRSIYTFSVSCGQQSINRGCCVFGLWMACVRGVPHHNSNKTRYNPAILHPHNILKHARRGGLPCLGGWNAVRATRTTRGTSASPTLSTTTRYIYIFAPVKCHTHAHTHTHSNPNKLTHMRAVPKYKLTRICRTRQTTRPRDLMVVRAYACVMIVSWKCIHLVGERVRVPSYMYVW